MFKGKKILAIIPARGGSKRIKNKNIVNFKGEPMIVKTLKIANLGYTSFELHLMATPGQ